MVKFANCTKLSWGGIWRKELRNGLSLADDDIIRGGLGLVTDKTKKKKPNPQQEPLAYGARLKKKKPNPQQEPLAYGARLISPEASINYVLF